MVAEHDPGESAPLAVRVTHPVSVTDAVPSPACKVAETRALVWKVTLPWTRLPVSEHVSDTPVTPGGAGLEMGGLVGAGVDALGRVVGGRVEVARVVVAVVAASVLVAAGMPVASVGLDVPASVVGDGSLLGAMLGPAVVALADELMPATPGRPRSPPDSMETTPQSSSRASVVSTPRAPITANPWTPTAAPPPGERWRPDDVGSDIDIRV